MKYLVMDIDRDEAIVLDQNGSFLRVENRDYCKGDTVDEVVLLVQPRRKIFTMGRVGAVAAVLAAAVVFVIYLYFWRPVSSIQVSALSDVTLRLNSYGQVIAIDALDARGRRLIDSYTYRYKPHMEVVEDLLDRLIAEGYLADRGTLTFVVRGENLHKTREWSDNLRANMRARFAGRPGINLVLNDIREHIGEWDDHDDIVDWKNHRKDHRSEGSDGQDRDHCNNEDDSQKRDHCNNGDDSKERDHCNNGDDNQDRDNCNNGDDNKGDKSYKDDLESYFERFHDRLPHFQHDRTRPRSHFRDRRKHPHRRFREGE